MSSSPSPSPEKPADRITVPVRGADKTIFMSFGLLNEIASLVGGPENVPYLSFNAGTASAALELMLAERDKRGKILETDEPAIPFDFMPETAEQLLDWAGAHVLDFFIRRYAKSVKLLADQATPLAEVGSSLSSSQS